MTFYLIGLGLNENSISQEGLEAVRESDKVYLEYYTVDFPYLVHELEEKLGKKVAVLNREKVEGEDFVLDAKKKNITLLVYGAPLSATTHYSLILKCIKESIPHKIIYAGSIFDAVAESGLQQYKFGKVASMPAWKHNYQPDSFGEIIKENIGIGAHTLILVDIGLDFQDALRQLKEVLDKKEITLEEDRLIVCSHLGTESRKILHANFENLIEQNIKPPYCFIIPSKMHFMESEALKIISEE